MAEKLDFTLEGLSTQKLIKVFFTVLLTKIRERRGAHANLSPPRGGDNWIAKSSHIAMVSYLYRVRKNTSVVELYLDPAPSTNLTSEDVFNILLKHRHEIDRSFNGKLIWESRVNRRVRKILSYIDLGGYKDHDIWSEIHHEMIRKMENLIKIFSNYPLEFFESQKGMYLDVPNKMEVDNVKRQDTHEDDPIHLVDFYIADNKYQDAQRLLTEYATKGNREAQRKLGLLYVEDLKEIPIDKQEAAFWIESAAEQGDEVAQYHMGIFYFNGIGVKKDLGTSFHWIALAAQKGEKRSQEILDMLARC